MRGVRGVLEMLVWALGVLAVRMDPDDLEILQASGQDPEVVPGLLEGDMAMSSDV